MNAWLRKNRGYVLLSLAHIVFFGGLMLWRQPAPAPIRIVDPTPKPTPTPRQLVVHVSGAVSRPGVYTLPDNSRLIDAVEAAGGLRGDAAGESLNLAAPLADGQRVHVPVLGQEPATTDSPGAVPVSSAGPAAAGGPVNLNTAAVGELESLPGIGPALAARIVEDRIANGPYTTVDDLMRVRGIGAATLDKIRPYVMVR
ncbi:MAG: helix-hairpin-helix domain-containing protein [Anaerolineae bacterium]